MAIYYLCPEIDFPLGGVKVIYKHVDLLNQLGFEAFVLHNRKGFRCTWFDNNTRISDGSNVNKEDFVVAPEIMVNKLFGFSCRKIIFNQNVYYMPEVNLGCKPDAYLMKGLEKVIVVSEDNYDYLIDRYPDLNVSIVRNNIDSGIFSFGKNKKKQIAYMSRKNPEHVNKIVSKLQKNPEVREWTFVDINQVSEQQVAQILQTTSIYLATGYPEGFGLPAAEALACGCKVIGYDGFGGREFFTKCHTDIIEYGDLKTFVSKTVESVKDFHRAFDFCRWESKEDSDYILNYYSTENQMQELYQVYKELSLR